MSAQHKKKPEDANLPAITGAAQLPAHLAQAIESDAGKGVSRAAEDNIVPLIKVLQALSPVVQRTNPERIEGAEPGDIFLKGCLTPIVKGSDGIMVQPCFFHKAWVEWASDQPGSGFITSHQDRPEEATEHPDPKDPQKKVWRMPNGHPVIETRNHSVLVYLSNNPRPLPYVIPFAGSGHTVSRNWMFMQNQKQVGNARAPSFSCLYKMTTRPRKNAKGEWYVFNVEDMGWVPDEARYNLGKQIYESFASGLLRAEEPAEDDVAQDSTTATGQETM
jgi:hypothetical protein